MRNLCLAAVSGFSGGVLTLVEDLHGRGFSAAELLLQVNEVRQGASAGSPGGSHRPWYGRGRWLATEALSGGDDVVGGDLDGLLELLLFEGSTTE